jgi:hypothetical protein
MITQKEIDSAIRELGEAMTEMFILDKQDSEIKIMKAKAQKRLSLAREHLRGFNFN